MFNSAYSLKLVNSIFGLTWLKLTFLLRSVPNYGILKVYSVSNGDFFFIIGVSDLSGKKKELVWQGAKSNNFLPCLAYLTLKSLSKISSLNILLASFQIERFHILGVISLLLLNSSVSTSYCCCCYLFVRSFNFS